MPEKILIVEDDQAMALTLAGYLGPEGYDTSIAHTGADAMKMLEEQNPAGVLLDLRLPDMHGFDILKFVQKKNFHCAVIVLTGEASMRISVEAMQLGAYDFLPKPASPERLIVSLKNALERLQLKEIVHTYQRLNRENFQGFAGKSLKMQAVYSVLENAAQSKASVFITGESGTGKELAAQAIHNLSTRADRPFEVLNCAAIPHNLLESEIFGHVKGAFTGATSDRVGAALRADGGTLFLDELGEMPMDLQAKLLRFIQTGKFRAVGDSRMQDVDVRFICATNRNPKSAIAEGLLREDLYYRLNVIPVYLPPLREREDDILLLARHFLEKSAHEENKDFREFSPAVEKIFMNTRWPGNVRQLENEIRRIVVLNDDTVVRPEMLTISEAPPETAPELTSAFLPERPDEVRALKLYEQDIISKAIEVCGGNISEASRRLDINPATIHRKLKQWRRES